MGSRLRRLATLRFTQTVLFQEEKPETDESNTASTEEIDPLENLEGEPNREGWKAYFESDRTERDTRLKIQKLQRGEHFDHIVVALEEALRAGEAEPWMYEVLALSMEIEGYPEKEVERVLLSMADFNVRDVQNLLGSAAYLVRLGADKQALKMYRQVSRMQPTRPEPYLLGLRLADRLEDLDALLWSASGILTYYWFDGYQEQHEKALNRLGDWKLRLKKEGRDEAIEQINETIERALYRDLKLKLTWSGDADLDLIVQEPLGTVCSFENRHTASGGALLHEGAGPKQSNCYEEYVCAYAAPGDYIVTARHQTGRIVGNRAKLTVTRYAGTDREQTQSVNIVFDKKAKKYRISLHQGRRTEKSPVFEPEELSNREKQRRTQIVLNQLRQQLRRRPAAILNQTRNNPIGTVGFSPVIAPVSSGVQLNASAVVSADRRHVRLGVNAAFTAVPDVFTFSFASGF